MMLRIRGYILYIPPVGMMSLYLRHLRMASLLRYSASRVAFVTDPAKPQAEQHGSVRTCFATQLIDAAGDSIPQLHYC